MSHARSSKHKALIFLLLTLGSFSCKHKAAAAAPAAPPPVAAAAAPSVASPTVTLRIDRPAITRGQSATLTITSQNATSVTIDPALGTVPLNGDRQITPASSVTYVATARGPGGTANDSVRVTVNDPPAPAATPIRATAPTATPAPLALDEQIRRSMQTILFDYDKADIRADQTTRVQAAAAFLKQNPSLRFTIEGHCDDRGSEEYNLALGDRRANAVKQYLVGQGIAESRLATVSYGEERSVCHDQTEDCYQRNRRAAFAKVP